jgi:hypothetical protein
MWKMLFFLWLIPIVLAFVAAKRVADGRRVITPKELRYVFGEAQRQRLSPWFWLAVFGLAIGFFALGVIQAVVLLNGGVLLAAFAPLLTAGLLSFLLVLLMRNRFSYRGAPRNSRQPARRESIKYSPDF